MAKFSVIIPVYNTESLLLIRCLESLKQQTYTHYELLLIDDGSKKECAELIDELAMDIPSCNVIHTKNNGVSVARNIGIDSSRGEYVVFVDADDIVSPYMLEEMNDCIIRYNYPDIVYGMVRRSYDVPSNASARSNHNNHFLLDEENKKKLSRQMIALHEKDFFDNNSNYVSRGPIARAIKRHIVAVNRFPEGLNLGEDGIWNLMILTKIDTAVVMKSVWYYYLINENSASNGYDENIVGHMRAYLNKLNEVCGGDSDLHATIYSQTLNIMCNLLKMKFAHSQYGGTNKQANIEYRKSIKKDEFVRYEKLYIIVRLSIKDIMKYLFFCINKYPVYLYKSIRLIRTFFRKASFIDNT